MKRQSAHLIQLGTHPGGNDLTFANGRGGFLDEFSVESGKQVAAWRELLEVGEQGSFPGGGVGHVLHGVKATADVPHFAGIDAPRAGLGRQTFQVAHPVQDLPKVVPQTHFFRETPHGFVPRLDGRQFRQRRHQRTSQCPATHGRARAVEDVHKGGAIRMVGM